jgi:RimJ/RimL family protein N-acetyltransferase
MAVEYAPCPTLAGDYEVAKMLDAVPFPYPAGEGARWISTHEDRRDGGREYPFAIEREGELVGSVGLNREADGLFHFGYWIGQPHWGNGYATEASKALLTFAFDELGERVLNSGHYADNHASGRVMTKLGFRYTRESMHFCKARGTNVRFLDTRLMREHFRR